MWCPKLPQVYHGWLVDQKCVLDEYNTVLCAPDPSKRLIGQDSHFSPENIEKIEKHVFFSSTDLVTGKHIRTIGRAV